MILFNAPHFCSSCNHTMSANFDIRAIGLERMVYGDVNAHMKKIMGDKIPRILLFLLKRMIKKRALDQGIGRHTQQEVTEMMTKNLKSVSLALGNKKFFGGDQICEDDCGIFGVLAQAAWGAPDTPYEKLMDGKCAYCKHVFPIPNIPNSILWSNFPLIRRM